MNKWILIILFVFISFRGSSQSIMDSCFTGISQHRINSKYEKRYRPNKKILFGFIRPPYTFAYYTSKSLKLKEMHIIVDTLSNHKHEGVLYSFTEKVISLPIPDSCSCALSLSTNDATRVGKYLTCRIFAFRLNEKLHMGDSVSIPIIYFSPIEDILVYANRRTRLYHTWIDDKVFELPRCDSNQWRFSTIRFVVTERFAGRQWLSFYGDEMAFLAPCCYPKLKVGEVSKEDTIVVNNVPKDSHFDTLKSFTIPGVLFQTNSSEFEPDSTFESFADYLAENENIRIEIVGYTDNIGDSKYNLKLSKQRAEAVYNAFLSMGIAEDRIKFTGKGASNPVAENNSEEGRQRNRRVEIVIIREQ